MKSMNKTGMRYEKATTLNLSRLGTHQRARSKGIIPAVIKSTHNRFESVQLPYQSATELPSLGPSFGVTPHISYK